MKSILFFVIIYLASTDGAIRSRFKNIKCTALNKTVATFNFCYLKAYSRTYVSINWGITRHMPFVKPIDVIQFYQTVFKLFQPFAMILGENQNFLPLRTHLSRSSSCRVWMVQHRRWNIEEHGCKRFCGASEDFCVSFACALSFSSCKLILDEFRIE